MTSTATEATPVADTWRTTFTGPSALMLEQKSAQAAPVAGGIMDVSDDGYEYTLILSATGIVDAVNDVPVPGCYANTLKKRMPKQIAGHDWNRPQGKYLWVKELPPGDPGLPEKTPQGDPWPKEAGALIGRVRLFKGTREGDEAKARWKELGNDLQLSIGYQVKKASRDPRTGTRYIQELELYENSEVLWGASPISGPMPSALAVKVLVGVEMETKGGDQPIVREGYDPVDVAALHVAADDEIDWEEVAAAAEEAPDDSDLDADVDDDAEETEDQDDADDAPEEPPAEGTERVDPGLLAEAAELGVQTKAAPAAPKKKPQQESQNNNGDFNSKHPRGRKGTSNGGKFVKKGDVAPASDKDNDGLPDNWLAMIKAGDSRYAANDKKKGGSGKGKGGAKKGRSRQSEKARAAKLAARAAEMDRRDKVDAAFAEERAAEDERRDGYARMLERTTSAADKTEMRRLETERRRTWNASWKKRRALEMGRRRAWESTNRNQAAKDAAAKASSTETKHLPSGEVDPDVPHAYVPSDDGTECEDCDYSAKTLGVHTDPTSVLAGYAWVEEQTWTGALADMEEKAEGGADKNRGNAERLRRWYLREAGIPWGTPGDWSRCVTIASKHMRPEQAKGYCALRHREATSEWPGRNAHGGKKSIVVRLESAVVATAGADFGPSGHLNAKALSVVLPSTSAAVTAPSGGQRGDLGLVVSAKTEDVPQLGSTNVLRVGDRFEVLGANATAYEAKVVDLKSIGDRAVSQLVGQLVRRDDQVAVTTGDPSVALSPPRAGEQKARPELGTALGHGAFHSEGGQAFGGCALLVREGSSQVGIGALGVDAGVVPGAHALGAGQLGAAGNRAGGASNWGTKGATGSGVAVPLPAAVVGVAQVAGDDGQAWALVDLAAHGRKDIAESMEYDAFDAEEKLITWEPDAEIGDAAAWRPVETKAASLATEAIPGTLEEHREAVRMAVQEALRGEGETGDDGKTRWNSVQLVATFPDKAIVRRYRWDDGAESEETYAVPYSFTDNGSVTLGEPEPVVIRAHIEGMDKPEPGEIAEELDEHPAVGLVEDATYAVKALGAATLETKAGRVLSRVNEQRLRDAITHLLAVCGVAGVQVDLPSQKQADDAQGKVGGKAPEPSFQPDTTSVEARETKTRLTPAEVAEAMALMASLP